LILIIIILLLYYVSNNQIRCLISHSVASPIACFDFSCLHHCIDLCNYLTLLIIAHNKVIVIIIIIIIIIIIKIESELPSSLDLELTSSTDFILHRLVLHVKLFFPCYLLVFYNR